MYQGRSKASAHRVAQAVQICTVICDKPYEMLRLIFLFVASLESTSFRIDIVEILSDLKIASPFLKIFNRTLQKNY